MFSCWQRLLSCHVASHHLDTTSRCLFDPVISNSWRTCWSSDTCTLLTAADTRFDLRPPSGRGLFYNWLDYSASGVFTGSATESERNFDRNWGSICVNHCWVQTSYCVCTYASRCVYAQPHGKIYSPCSPPATCLFPHACPTRQVAGKAIDHGGHKAAKYAGPAS